MQIFANVLGQTTTAPAVTLQIESIWDFVVKGGPTMIPIGLVSLVALAVTIERLLVLRRRSVAPPEFLAGLKGVVRDPRRAIEYCKANGSPIANVLAAAIRHLNDSSANLDRAVEEAGHRELVRFRHRMRLMSALPQISTMLGLLGTIFGMIKTFQAVAASGESIGKTEMLARGIYEAWTTTASGLLVAIPVLVAYHLLQGKIDQTVAELDRVTIEWVEEQRGESAVKHERVGEYHRELAPVAGVTAPIPVAAS